MSSTSSGRAKRRATTEDMSSWSTTGISAPVQVRTTSAAAISSSSLDDRHDPPADPLGQARAPVGTAVDHHDLADAVRRQGDGGALADLSGSDHDHPRPAQRPEPFLGHLHRGVRDRRRPPSDTRLRPGPLADLDRATEEQVERGPGGAFALGQHPRVAHLAQDLRLAQDG